MLQLQRRFGVRLFAIIALCVQLWQCSTAAESVSTVPELTPRDVIAWMAPMRVENGRLSVDWGSVGLIAAQHAGVVSNGAEVLSKIDTDVKFTVSAAQISSVNAPEFQLMFHAKGGSPETSTREDMPISVNISEKGGAGSLRGEFEVHGRLGKNGKSYDASDMRLNLDSPTCLALYNMNRKTHEYRMKFKEDRILKLDLSITESNNILLIRFENTDVGTGFDFSQKPNGEAELSYSQGEAKRMVRAAGFHELIQKAAAEMQLNFFRPLSDVGVHVALCPDLPVVMAAATTGFSDPFPENVKKADALIKAIAEGVFPADRARAVTDLTRFFPQAIFHISKVMDETQEPNLKAAIQKAIAAHPGIASAMPYVLQQKLHVDHDYLFDIFEHVPLLRDAARARLVALGSKDYGDNPDDWRK